MTFSQENSQCGPPWKLKTHEVELTRTVFHAHDYSNLVKQLSRLDLAIKSSVVILAYLHLEKDE